MAMVNNLCSWVRRYLRGYVGMDLNYLQSYLNWYAYLFRVKRDDEKWPKVERVLRHLFHEPTRVSAARGSEIIPILVDCQKNQKSKDAKSAQTRNAGLTFDDFSNGGYLYATMQDGRKAVAIFESLASLSISRTEHVTSGDFASEMPVSTTMTAEFNTLNIGKVSISLPSKSLMGSDSSASTIRAVFASESFRSICACLNQNRDDEGWQ